jgi:hypothetical protein
MAPQPPSSSAKTVFDPDNAAGPDERRPELRY